MVCAYIRTLELYPEKTSGSPGIQLAKNTMWITAGYILASFKIEKALDSNGNVVEPSGNCDEGLVK